MKELSIEEKAKRYDDLLVKLQEAKVDNDVCDERYCCVIDNIVPELKESKDERIRKCIEDLIKENTFSNIYGVTKDDCLAWLEKQGEHKHADTEKGTNGNNREIPNSEPLLTIKHAKEVMGIKQDDAWSEEELYKIENALFGTYAVDVATRLLNKIKSLNERYTWKPTMEQLTVLSKAIELRPLYERDGTILMSLYYDLKKLTE